MMCNTADPKSTGLVPVWQETFPVRFGAIDRSDRLTLHAIFQFFQELAISHAENLGVGREDMTQKGQIWILSRVSVQIERRPKYCETITVRSWPRGSEKLFALRDYDILDAAGETAVRARSGWIIIDLEKRRPMRPEAVSGAMPQNEGMNAMDSIPASLAGHDTLSKIGERKALYTDIDYNGHVNNTRYIGWIEDVMDPKVLENADKMRFEINYLNEIQCGDVTEIWFAADNAYAFEGRNAASGQAAFRAELRL
jgi:acyl-ACP thioesterase